MTSTSETFLRVVPLFAGLEVPTLGEIMSWLEIEAGQTLARQGASGDALYIVVSGRVAASPTARGPRRPRELGPRISSAARPPRRRVRVGVRALEPTCSSAQRSDFRGVVLGAIPAPASCAAGIVALACSRLGPTARWPRRWMAGRRNVRSPRRGQRRPGAPARSGGGRRRGSGTRPTCSAYRSSVISSGVSSMTCWPEERSIGYEPARCSWPRARSRRAYS